MSKNLDTIKNKRAVYTLEINLGRSRDDGLPKKATGATLICYSTGITEDEAVREAVATLRCLNMAPLNVVGYGSIQDRLEGGHEIDDEENNLMTLAIDENSVIVAHVMPLYGNDIEADKIN
jgi:hypothetical protein